jgi:hypothetical protein
MGLGARRLLQRVALQADDERGDVATTATPAATPTTISRLWKQPSRRTRSATRSSKPSGGQRRRRISG